MDQWIICLNDSFKKWFKKINLGVKQITGFMSEIMNHSFSWFLQIWLKLFKIIHYLVNWVKCLFHSGNCFVFTILALRFVLCLYSWLNALLITGNIAVFISIFKQYQTYISKIYNVKIMSVFNVAGVKSISAKSKNCILWHLGGILNKLTHFPFIYIDVCKE